MKKAISAKIDEEVLQYCKNNGGKLNTLINDLLRGWMEKNQQKQLIAFQVETGTDELSQLGTDLKCSQCCRNCIYYSKENKPEYKGTGCKMIPLYDRVNCNEFACIYWEKKKGSK